MTSYPYIPFEARSNVRGILVLLIGDIILVVEVFGAQSPELLTRVLFPFCGGVVVAQSTALRQFRDKMTVTTLRFHGHTP